MNKPWQPYAHHILDTIEKIHRIEARGSIIDDEILSSECLVVFSHFLGYKIEI